MAIKKKIHKLSFEFDTDFVLIGIASHENDYRLSWAINKSLGLELIKREDLQINHPNHKLQIDYSVYGYDDSDNYLNYHLISNKSDQGFLLPKMKNIDFILRVSGFQEMDLINDLLFKLKKIDIIITAFVIDNLTDRMHKMFIF